MVSLDWRRKKAHKGLQYFHRVIASASTEVGGAASPVRRLGKIGERKMERQAW